MVIWQFLWLSVAINVVVGKRSLQSKRPAPPNFDQSPAYRDQVVVLYVLSTNAIRTEQTPNPGALANVSHLAVSELPGIPWTREMQVN